MFPEQKNTKEENDFLDISNSCIPKVMSYATKCAYKISGIVQEYKDANFEETRMKVKGDGIQSLEKNVVMLISESDI